MIGFTTESHDSRSTKYASDLAKGFEIPIVHVNADDPEACLAAVYIAILYRNKFHKDFLIDLIGYRRYGHNEMDEPMATNPLLYEKIKKHETICKLYAKQLESDGIISLEDARKFEQEVQDRLKKHTIKFQKTNTKKRKFIFQKRSAMVCPKSTRLCRWMSLTKLTRN